MAADQLRLLVNIADAKIFALVNNKQKWRQQLIDVSYRTQ